MLLPDLKELFGYSQSETNVLGVAQYFGEPCASHRARTLHLWLHRVLTCALCTACRLSCDRDDAGHAAAVRVRFAGAAEPEVGGVPAADGGRVGRGLLARRRGSVAAIQRAVRAQSCAPGSARRGHGCARACRDARCNDAVRGYIMQASFIRTPLSARWTCTRAEVSATQRGDLSHRSLAHI